LLVAAINSLLLVTSSLTMTFAIHAAHEGDQKGLKRNLLLTVALAVLFLGLKAREYYIDYEEHLIPGTLFTTPLAHEDSPAKEFEDHHKVNAGHVQTVTVKLDNEAGAAGLVFHADGGDRHYGFYPSGGADASCSLRWSRRLLVEGAWPEDHAHYRPGEWNTLRVRLEKGRIRCFVNDRPVFDVEEDAFSKGMVRAGPLPRHSGRVQAVSASRVPCRRPVGCPARADGKVDRRACLRRGPFGLDGMKKLPPGDTTTLAALREKARFAGAAGGSDCGSWPGPSIRRACWRKCPVC